MCSRKLDVLVAENIFGHKVVHTTWGKDKQYECYTIGEPDYLYTGDCPEGERINDVPYYSMCIEDAWLVVEELKNCGVEISYDFNNNYWCCRMQCGKIEVYKEAVAEAICIAALKVYDIDYKE